MARNKFDRPCYICGLTVKAGTGHFERHRGGWRTKHANVPGDGRVTCATAQASATEAQQKEKP
ncbi:hypothetical protein [Azorhizobium caulinodans]|uniref:hypothetical protein n=1 Tax=Azorhizobium caulinodans TaxID=7 RepID=UPI002FBDAD66